MLAWLSDRLGRFYCQLGEMTGIGATCHLLRILGKTILIDFGVSISRNGEFQVQGVPAGDYLIGHHIDLIIITHAHLDHFGAIARLIRHHPEAKVIVSRPAIMAIEFMLWDSLKITGEEQNRARHLGLDIGEPIFTEVDLINFLNNPNLIVVGLPCWLDAEDELGPDWKGWEIGFHDSGHDIGAMMTYIIDPSDWRYLFTGDVCSHAQLKGFLEGVMLSDRKSHGDVFDKHERLTMITEANNGDRPMVETPEQVLAKFGAKLKEVENRGGQVLVAAFCKNRCSKMALACIELGYKPVVDGSGRTMMRLELGDDRVDQLLKSGQLIYIDQDTKDNRYAGDRHRNLLLSGERGFHPVIAPSGTLEGGYSVSWAYEILPGEADAVIFPGYLFPESTSNQIFKIDKGCTVNLKMWDKAKRQSVPTPADVRSEICHFDFTSHDYQGGLVERVRLAKPKTLIVHHCDESAYDALAEKAIDTFRHTGRILHGSHMRVIDLNL